MIKSKVIELLKELTKEELKRFGDYLSSPFFNKRSVLVDLLNTYKKFHPEFEHKSLTKEKVFSKLFPGKSYNDENFRNLNSLLLKNAENFLSFLNYENNPFAVKKHLLSEINHRKIFSLFEKNFEETKKIIESYSERDMNYFQDMYSLYLQKDIFNSIMYKFSKEDIMISERHLLSFFVMKLLEIHNYIIYQCKVLGLSKENFLQNDFMDKLFKIIPEDITNMPQIQIYYIALKLEQTDDRKYYDKFKKILKEHGGLLDKEKHYNNYLYMIDYIKRTREAGDLDSVSELFHLRKEIIEKNLLMENTIKNMFFLNLVKSGLRLKEHDWVFKFIMEYQPLLSARYKDATVNLSLALYYFDRKDFDKSLSHAAQVGYEDNFYNLEVKNLTARIFFETYQYDALISFISSYRMYLSKNRTLSKKEFSSHNKFLNFLDKLIRIKEQKKFYKVKALMNDADKAEFVSNSWVMDKANGLLE